MKKRVLLSILSACIVLSSGCSKPVDKQTGELKTKAEVTLASGESTEELLQNETVEFGIENVQPTTQEPAGTTGVSGEQTTASDERLNPTDTEPVTEEPTAPSDEVVTEPVTEPAAEVVIPTQKETTGPKATESVTVAPTQSTTQKATAAQPATQKPTEAVTQAPTKPAIQKPTEAPTQKPTEVQTTAPAPTEEETTETPTRKKTAWDYPWDLDAIEAELRAYGESLGILYIDEALLESDWDNSVYLQSQMSKEEYVQRFMLTPEHGNWHVPTCMYSDENEYLVGRNQSDLIWELEYLAARGTTEGFRIYFELDETATACIVYVLY